MTSQSKLLGILALLLLAAVSVWLYTLDDGLGNAGDPAAVTAPPVADRTAGPTERSGAPSTGPERTSRAVLERDPASVVGVRGVVLDVKTRAPLAGVEVVALQVLPNLERPITRLSAMFREGLWTDTSKPVKILGSGVTGGDGSFEIYGLPPGRVYLDARSERAYIRNPGNVRLARGQIREGVELLASPGGRIIGQVFGPEGQPATNTRVSVRPGLNAFLGQITQRKYKWLEAMTDQEGRFVIAGVPTGDGYSVTVASQEMALEERHGIDVDLGETVELTIRGKIGANVTGRVVTSGGRPVTGAEVAMVYLDIGRMVFSADGRDEPITSDANGYFQLPHVAPGRVAFIAASDSLAPSNIHELAVVDGGVYNDVLLTLDEGRTFRGLVVDGEDRPLPGVDVAIRPLDDDDGPRRGSDAMKLVLKVRKVEARTGADGRFETQGVAGERLSLRFTKPGYITVAKRGTKVDTKDFKVVMTRGVTVRGRVQTVDGKPVTRFRVKTRSRAAEADSAVAKAGDEERSGVRVEVGGRGRRGARMRGEGWRRGERTTRTRDASVRDGNGRGDGWDEVKSAAGQFSLPGLPSGKVRVEVQADGYLDPERQEVALAPGEDSEELVFVLDPGATCRGTVRDATTGQPVAEATVTAYLVKKKADDEDAGFELFKSEADPEDFDFLGTASGRSQRSSMTDGFGRFEVQGLKAGDYRFTARHPDMAKASVTDVKVIVGPPIDGIEIQLTAGGAIEGIVTGKGKLPLGSAMVVAFSPSAGSFKSDATDERGFYRIDGLPKGQYIVFKSRMDERSQDLATDLMSNMRLKTTMVRPNKTTRRDIHDETDSSVRVFGVVRDAGKPVSRALITMLGRDRDGILGMGIRTKPTADDGAYEIIGVEPGEYLVQISRFRNRAEQSNLTVEIPAGVRDYKLDLDIPQSFIEGIVQDSAGNPVAGIPVRVGLQEEAPIDGLVGIMLKNGLGNARTDDAGRFKIQGLARGVYRVTAGGTTSVQQRGIMPQVRGGGRGGGEKWGEVALQDVQLDGVTPQTGLVLILPRAGSITGIVVDAAGAPVANAAITATSDDRQRRLAERRERALTDLFGLQARPVRSGADGRFELSGLSPGKYRVHAEVDGLAPGEADDVAVTEGTAAEVRLEVIKGATLKLRVRNIDGSNLPIANISVLDGKGRPLASNVSAMSVFLRYMRGRQKKDSSGWHEIGGIRPDTYTVIIKEKGQPELRIVRTVRDGEEARWDIDMAAELERHKESKKQD